MNFGEAVHALKQCRKVARAGWNGKGMFIFLNKGSVAADAQGVQIVGDTEGAPLILTERVEGISESLFDVSDKGTVTRLPNLNMRAASGSTVTGWLASQTDILAEDWEVLN